MYRSRRRRGLALIVLLSVLPAVAIVAGVLLGDRERIESYFIDADVGVDGRTRIVETIDYDFGSLSERHGIYRIIPDLPFEPNLQVSSPDAPDDALLTFDRIRIGDPNVTISGLHRYVIAYDHDSLVSGQSFAWNAIGTEWTAPIEHAEIHVRGRRAFLSPTCDQGSFGQVGGCTATQIAPGHLLIETDRVPSGHAVTVRAQLGGPVEFQDDTPTAPPVQSSTGAPVLVPFVAAWLLSLLAAVGMGRYLRWLGREQVDAMTMGALMVTDGPLPSPPGSDVGAVDVRDLDRATPSRVDPPRELTPSEGGVLLEERVTPAHQAAWLIDQAVHGAVEIDPATAPPLLRWRGEYGAASNQVLLAMFSGRSTVSLDSYDASFSRGWGILRAELTEWMDSSDLWDQSGNVLRRRARWGGFVVALVALAIAGLDGFVESLRSPSVVVLVVPAVVFGLGLGAFLRAWELRRRSPKGSALWMEVEGFRRFLDSTTATEAARAQAEDLLDAYTSWAVALGVADHWTAKLREAGFEDTGDMAFYYAAPRLTRACTTASVAPSSSSDSGGGGGGAGGGGGGGGGGSW